MDQTDTSARNGRQPKPATGSRSPRDAWLNPRGMRFWALTVILLYTLVGFFLVPHLLKNGVISFIENDLGRNTHIEKVEFNPYVLSLRVLGFELIDTDQVRLAAFDQLFVNFQLSSLVNWAWTFDEINLRGSYFYFERFTVDNTRLSRLVEDATAGQTGKQEIAEEPQQRSLPRLLINQLILSGGRGDIRDNVPKNPVEMHVGPIDIGIEQLNTLPDRFGQQNVTIKLPGNAALHWEGNLGLAPLQSEGKVSLEYAPLDNIIAYLEALLPLETVQALLSSHFNYKIHLDDDGIFNAEITELAIDIDNLALRGLTPTADFLSIPNIALKGGTIRYPQQSAQFNRLHIEAPTISSWLNKDGSLNLAALAPAGPNESESASSAELMLVGEQIEESSKPWQLGVDLISIANGRVGFSDNRIDPAPQIYIDNIALTLGDFSTLEATQLPVNVSGKFRAGGELSVDGTLKLKPGFSLNLKTKTREIPLSIAQSYAQQNIDILIEEGVLNSDLNITIPGGQKPIIAGSVEIPHLKITNTDGKDPLIAWQELELKRFELDLNANRLDISVLDFEQLYARFAVHKDLSTNISDLLVDTNSGATAKANGIGDKTSAPMQSAPLEIVIGGIRVKDASLDFSDMSLPLPFAAHVDKLDGTIGGFATNSSESAKIKLEGQVNEFGLARIGGNMNLLDPLMHTDVALEFVNLDTARMSPYSGQFAGRKISGGKLTLSLNYAIENGIMDGKNDIVLSDFQLGDKIDSPNATSLPLDLAIALLKDPDGVIGAKLPVTGDVNDPQFALGSVIWDAFVGLITDAVTAPFRFLGNMLGIDSEELGQLQFLAGRTDLTPPELEKIAHLENAMTQRPELGVEISGTFDPDIDIPALQFITLQNTVIERLGENLNMANNDTMLGNDVRKTLENLFRERLPERSVKSLKATHKVPPIDDPNGKPVLDELTYTADLRDRLLATEPVSKQMLTELAKTRAEAIRTAFLESGNFDETRLTIIDPKQVKSEDGEWITVELAVNTH